MNRSARKQRLWRNRVAPVLFVVSFICWVPLVKAEIELVRKERALELFREESIRQQALRSWRRRIPSQPTEFWPSPSL